MKIIITLVVSHLLLSSCSRDPAPSIPATFNEFIGKYMVCDSVITINSGVRTTEVVGRGKGADVMYNSNGTYTVYYNPGLIKYYQYKPVDTVFYWDPPNQLNVNQFFVITSISGNRIVNREFPDLNKTYDYYYHAE